MLQWGGDRCNFACGGQMAAEWWQQNDNRTAKESVKKWKCANGDTADGRKSRKRKSIDWLVPVFVPRCVSVCNEFNVGSVQRVLLFLFITTTLDNYTANGSKTKTFDQCLTFKNPGQEHGGTWTTTAPNRIELICNKQRQKHRREWQWLKVKQ